jgi:hypothetical protein
MCAQINEKKKKKKNKLYASCDTIFIIACQKWIEVDMAVENNFIVFYDRFLDY